MAMTNDEMTRDCCPGMNNGHTRTGIFPGGLVGGPRVYQDQFRGFKSHRVHARRDFFLHKEIDWRKARERE